MKRIKKTVIEFRRQPIETYETRLIIADNKILLACMAVREITAALKDRFRWYLKLLIGFEICERLVKDLKKYPPNLVYTWALPDRLQSPLISLKIGMSFTLVWLWLPELRY